MENYNYYLYRAKEIFMNLTLKLLEMDVFSSFLFFIHVNKHVMKMTMTIFYLSIENLWTIDGWAYSLAMRSKYRLEKDCRF